MPSFFPALKEEHQEWIMKQPVFFVASAPLKGKHINVSPKGHPSRTLRILSPNKVIYLDHTGSGCETVSHLYENGNGRVTIMLNSFGSAPLIMRLFCTGKVVERDAPQYEELVSLFDAETASTSTVDDTAQEPENKFGSWQQTAIFKGARSVIVLDIFKVQTSCGYGVPLIQSSVSADRAAKLTKCANQDRPADGTYGDGAGDAWLDRETLPTWANKHTDTSLKAYWHKSNLKSLDGLPGLKNARNEAGERIGIAEMKIWIRRNVLVHVPGMVVGFLLAIALLVSWSDDRRRYLTFPWTPVRPCAVVMI